MLPAILILQPTFSKPFWVAGAGTAFQLLLLRTLHGSVLCATNIVQLPVALKGGSANAPQALL